MNTVLLVGTILLAAGVIVHTVIFRYATTRTVRVMTVIIAAFVSVPLLGLALIVLLGGGFEAATSMWALAVCGILFGYWFKSPLRTIQD